MATQPVMTVEGVINTHNALVLQLLPLTVLKIMEGPKELVLCGLQLPAFNVSVGGHREAEAENVPSAGRTVPSPLLRHPGESFPVHSADTGMERRLARRVVVNVAVTRGHSPGLLGPHCGDLCPRCSPSRACVAIPLAGVSGTSPGCPWGALWLFGSPRGAPLA